MTENKKAWAVSFNIQPEEIEIIKKTKMQSSIRIIGDDKKTLMSNESIFENYNDCLKDCIRKNYRYLQVHAQSCADLMDKIKRQEAKLDAERSK